MQTTETASKDLGKYYKALDRAITRFHGHKMKEINQIIRELWIKTYMGGDIDRIEVRSDDGAQSDGTTIATRRVYNYRVSTGGEGGRGTCRTGGVGMCRTGSCLHVGLWAWIVGVDRSHVVVLSSLLGCHVPSRC